MEEREKSRSLMQPWPVTVRLQLKMKFDPISLERLAEHNAQFSLAAMRELRNRPPAKAKNAI
jgi:hypothetical protein